MKQLFDYQRTDGAHIATRKSALVAHEPRVGKTNVAIHAADLLNAKLVVIVAPANVVNNWLRALDDFRQGDWIAVVVSWHKVGDLLKRLRPLKVTIDVLVLDESHYAKSRSAQRTKHVYGISCDSVGGLCELSSRTYCLTGTPLPNDPTELYPMLRSLASELILNDKGRPMSFSSFRDRYCAMVHTPFGMKIKGAKRYGELRAKLMDSGFAIRRTRKEVFGRDILPPTKVYIAPPSAYKSEIKAFEATEQGQKIKQAIERDGMQGLAKMEKEAAALRQLYGIAKVPGVASLVSEELDIEPDKKIVIGAWHTKVIDGLANALREYGVVMFDGRVDKARKVRLNDKFLRDPTCRVVVGQIWAMGVGLDFSSSDDVLFAEQSWVGTDNEQFRSRIFHPKSETPKSTRFAVLPGSTDELIGTACERKLKDARKIFDV